jgi:hypothetical protein
MNSKPSAKLAARQPSTLLAETLPKMEWTKSESAYSSRNEARTRELDARNYVCLRLVSRPRNGDSFFNLQVAPQSAVYRNDRNSSNGVDHHVGVHVGFSAENATGGDSIGLCDSGFQLLVCLPPITNVVQSSYE